MADRLTLLAEEFRLFKVEVEDRLRRLEDTASASVDASGKSGDTTSSSKKADLAP